MKPHLCIYHGNCADGFTAAWVVKQALGDDAVDFFAGVYQDPPPDCTGRRVLMVDFSYKRPVMVQILAQAESVLVLDHHLSAQKDLEALADTNLQVLFDMERSGARLAWDYFFPGVPPPLPLLHVEDRDLWRWDLPKSREITANIFSYPYDFDVWTTLMETPPHVLAEAGEAIERKHHKDVAELLAVTTRHMRIGGRRVPVANLPYTLASEAAGALAATGSFGACYWDGPEFRNFSLRSVKPYGEDVSEIAKQYGGGGHRHSAGFRVSYAEAAKFEVGD